MTQLLGLSTPIDLGLSNSHTFEAFNTDMVATQYTATASGVLDELHFYTSDAVVSHTTALLWLLIYADDGDSPGALLGQFELTGPFAPGVWLDGTGLSVPIVFGQKYWLAFMTGGGSGVLFFDIAAYDDSGTSMAFDNDELFSTPQDPWPGTYMEPNGPIAFYGTGTEVIAADAPITGLDFHVTGLWYPAAESIDYYGRIADPIDGEVQIPLNDSRTAGVTVSVQDPIVAALHGHMYARCLKVYYHGTLVFWGPAKLNEGSGSADTVRISAVDPSLRVIRHYLRRGDLDGDLNANSGDRGTVSIDRPGLELLLDAARNIPEQTARGCPDIGIALGTNDFTAAPDDLMGVSRGDEVWATMLLLSQSLGPDLELEPVDNTPGVYCQLNTYASQGADRSETVQLHYATGLDNLEDISWVEGEKYVTHDHVLSRDQQMRVSTVNVEASAETGQYTEWDVTDFDSHGIAPTEAAAVLSAFGTDVLRAYGRPLLVYSGVLPVERVSDGDDGTEFRYLRDYAVGDVIDFAGKIGEITLQPAEHRITRVTLKQEDNNLIRPTLDVVPNLIAADSVGDTEE